MSWIKMPTTASDTCPGIREFIRPTMRYVKCHQCGGDVEVWSDEDRGICIDCEAEWTNPNDGAPCLDYCEHAEQCKEIIKRKRA